MWDPWKPQEVVCLGRKMGLSELYVCEELPNQYLVSVGEIGKTFETLVDLVSKADFVSQSKGKD